MLTTVLLAASMVVGQAEASETMPVYAIHDVELNAGTDVKEFETFAAGEFANAYRDGVGGLRVMVLKGDRGAEKGKYKLLMVFESKQLRDKYYPTEGEGASEAMGEAVDQATRDKMQKLMTYLKMEGVYTDFVGLCPKPQKSE